MTVVEEWMYSNVFLVDLEESFSYWKLLESTLPDGDQLKLYLQNSLQATGKLRAMYLSHEDKRPDMEQQLRSWVTKVEAQIGEAGRRQIPARKWTISRTEPVASTGMPSELTASPKRIDVVGERVTSSFGNVFVMEDYFSQEKPLEVLMASTCPQLAHADLKPGDRSSVGPSQLPSNATAANAKSPSGLVGLGISSASLSGTLGKTTSSSSITVMAGSASPTSSHTATQQSVSALTGSTSNLNVPGGAASAHKRVSSGGVMAASATSTATNSVSSLDVASASAAVASGSSGASGPASPHAASTASFTHILVEINDLIMMVGQDAVLTLSLFSEDRFISEEYPILLPNQSPIVLDEKHRKVIFRDVPTEMIGNSLWLVARIVRFGKMKYNESKPSAKDSHDGYPVRRPYAVAVLSLSEILSTAQAEQEIQDSMSSTSNQGAIAVAKAATLRRRQFSNAPRPSIPDQFHGADASSTSDGDASTAPERTQRPMGSRKVLKDTLRNSAMRHTPQASMSIQEGTNSLSMRALNFVKSANQFMTLYAPTRDDIFPDLHSFIINNLRDKSQYLTFLPKAKGMLISVSRFEGAFAAVQHHPAFLAATPLSVCQLLSLPDQHGSGNESIAPRNDLYVTIEEAFLHDDKSFEILIEARNKFGAPATLTPSASQTLAAVAAPLGMLVSQVSSSNLFEPKGQIAQTIHSCPSLPLFASPPANSPSNAALVHRSIPYHHKKDPRPMETFKMELSRFQDVDHLYMTIRHVSESGKTSDMAFATLRLYQQDSSFIPNGTRKLSTYKPGSVSGMGNSGSDLLKRGTTTGIGTASRVTISPGSGITVPASKTTDDGQIATYLKHEDSLTRSNKSDYVSVNVNLVSTKITENIPLRALLNWQNSTTPDMSPLLEKCAHLSRKDIVNFYKDIFDTLLDLLVLLDDVRPVAFQTLMAILATCQSDPRNSQYDQLDPRGHSSLKHWVDRYLEEGMTNGKVYPFLMDSLHKLIQAVSTDSKANHRTLKLALKASPMLIKFILRSRQVAIQLGLPSSPSLPDYGGTAPRVTKGTETISTGMMPTKGSLPRGSKVSILGPAKAPTDGRPSEVFLSHGFNIGDSVDPTSSIAKQAMFNPLFNLPQIKLQHLYSTLGDDANFRKRYLALLESFSQLLSIPEPSLITLQALLVKAYPQMLQSSVFLLDKEHTSRSLERFLTALDDADQVQLNIEKLLLLEHFQFSPYVGISILIKHIKMHSRQSDEERFIALRIFKSMVRSILSQTFLGSLSPMSPIATIEAHPEDEMDAQYTSASLLTSESNTGPNAASSASLNTTGKATARGPLAGAFAQTEDKTKTRISMPPLSTSSTTSTGSTAVPVIPSRALYLVLLDLVPTLTRMMKKAEESDAETRRDIATIFLAILKIVTLKRLRGYLANLKSKHSKRSLESIVQLCLLLLKNPSYPLAWADLLLYKMKKLTHVIEYVLVPVVVQEASIDSNILGDVESKTWTRLFCVICYALRHPSLQLESYVANRSNIVSYLGDRDLRVNLARGLWALWQRFELFRIQLIPDAIPALLMLSSSPNVALSKLARTCYLHLLGREAQIIHWMNHVPTEKVWATVQPNRPRNTSSSGAAIAVRMLPRPPSYTSDTQGVPVSSGSSAAVGSPTASALGEPLSPNSSSHALSSGSADGSTSRARSNNATAAPRPAGPKRPVPLAPSGSSGTINRQQSSMGSTGSTGSASGGSSSANPSRLSSELSGSHSDLSAVTGLSLVHSSSGSNVAATSKRECGFPRLEVATIQALEEMSKSGAWSQRHLEAFFSSCKELTSDAASKLSNMTAGGRGSMTSDPIQRLTQNTVRSSSSGSLEPMAHPAILSVESFSTSAQTLQASLKEAMSSTEFGSSSLSDGAVPSTGPSAILNTMAELPPLRTRLMEFSTDMGSLVLLLASLRDLPRGAEYDEERAYALTQLMTYLRQTQHADAYLKYAYKLSKMYEEAGQYTEAAYAVLLHADMLDWSERLLPEMLTSPAMPSSKRKQQLLNQAIGLFDKGKAWEDAIKVSSDLCLALKNQLFDYPSLATQLKLQADLYLKIAEQDRFFSNYFYVAYYGTGFPNALRRKCFIYRGLELERIPHFISRMEKKFPNAEVLKTMDPPPSDLTDKNKERVGQFLQIFTVQPSSEAEMNGLHKNPAWLVPNMPEGTRKYHAANNVRVFQYSRPFKQPGAPKTNDDNAFEHIWSSQVYVVTEDSFPNIQRRLEIVQTSEIIRSPLENATNAVLLKNNELSEIIAKMQNSPNEIKVDRLSMALSGILDAAVNGGTAKYQHAFLSQKFIQDSRNNKKVLEGISLLQKALLAQLQVVSVGLNLHAELCPSNLQALHKRLESQYERMVIQITQAATATGPSQTHTPPVASSSAANPGATKIPTTFSSGQPKSGVNVLRIKDADARPSIIGFAAQMMANPDSPGQS